MKILLAIPCYNCERQIERVIQNLDAIQTDSIDEIIFINNNSSDQTAAMIQRRAKGQIKRKATLLNNHKNYGLGASFKIAFRYSLENRFDYFLFFHGDDQASTDDINLLSNEVRRTPHLSAVLGSRFASQSRLEGYSSIRKHGNIFLNFIFSLLTGLTITDIGSGINIYRTKDLESLKIQLWPNHIAFDINLLLGLIEAKKQFIFMPVSWREQDQVSNAGNIKTGLTVLLMLIKWKLGLKNHSTRWDQTYSFERITL
jgi:glycosyltransferase involved in cell wall biosynthesis